jgi:4-hydroxy-3-methylbut-2-en-1-yl diphosphate reductase
LIENFKSIEAEWLAGAKTVALTAGASAPEVLVEQVVEYLTSEGYTNLQEVEVMPENVRFGLPPEIVEAVNTNPKPLVGIESLAGQ